MNLGTRLFSWFKGRLVGTDAAGNRYFIEREPRARGARLRRWVLYPGAAAASSVPAGWNAWLSFGDGPPTDSARHPWEQPRADDQRPDDQAGGDDPAGGGGDPNDRSWTPGKPPPPRDPWGKP